MGSNDHPIRTNTNTNMLVMGIGGNLNLFAAFILKIISVLVNMRAPPFACVQESGEDTSEDNRGNNRAKADR